MRLLALVLTLTVTGPSVASLMCDWACAARHQVATASGGCHEHGTDALTPTMARGPQCHDVSPAPESVLTNAASQAGVPVVAITSLTSPLPTSFTSRAGAFLSGSSHAPPPSLIPLRI